MMLKLFCVFSILKLSYAFLQDNYNCNNGLQSDYRVLLISPQDRFMFDRILDEYSSRGNTSPGSKKIPHLTTLTGFIKGSQKCITVMETQATYSYLDVIDLVDEISVRCFDKVLIMVSISNTTFPLTNRESEMLVATMTLLSSVYQSDLWENAEVVFMHEQNKASRGPNLQNWFQTNVLKPVGGDVENRLKFLDIPPSQFNIVLQSLMFSISANTLEQKFPNFLNKSGGLPWIGEPFEKVLGENGTFLDVFIMSENFEKEQLSLICNNREIDSTQMEVIEMRNDLFQVKLKIPENPGVYRVKYHQSLSINYVQINKASGDLAWSAWSPWSKCVTISEMTNRTRSQNGFQESESRPCRCSDLKDYPTPRILLIGKTGVGKSSLGNQLLGGFKAFASGHGTESKTLKISVYTGNVLGTGECITLIDTPGTKDTKGRDYQHTLEMQKLLKNHVKSFEAILLLTSGMEPRVDSGTIELLKWYEAVFGQDMWKHVIMEVTFWSHKMAAIQERMKNRQTDENSFSKGLTEKIKTELSIPSAVQIPVVFIDPVYGGYEDPCLDPDNAVESNEVKKFKTNIYKLWGSIEDLKKNPYNCKVRCMAPDVFFSGGPFVSIPANRELIIKPGEKYVIEWQIWTGLTLNHTIAYDILFDDIIIYKKQNGVIERLYEGKKFDDLYVEVNEVNKIPKVTIINLSIRLEKNSRPLINKFTAELRNRVESPAQVNIMVAKDATLGDWSTWSPCSITCINEGDPKSGQQTRERECQAEENGGMSCGELLGQPELSKNSSHAVNSTRLCTGGDDGLIIQCPVDMRWSLWSEWGDCSANCGSGKKTRIRTCFDGRHGGSQCTKVHEKESEPCKAEKECPRNCKLGIWSAWSECSASCNNHNMTSFSSKIRSKEILHEANEEGVSCEDMSRKETQICPVPFCPVDGVWSEYSSLSKCSVTCGGGFQVAYRHCIGPIFNGKPCEGESIKYEFCKLAECPVDCRYKKWSSWSSCSTTCGPGQHRRTRVKVEPKFGGKECEEEVNEDMVCFVSQCPMKQQAAQGGGPVSLGISILSDKDGKSLLDSMKPNTAPQSAWPSFLG